MCRRLFKKGVATDCVIIFVQGNSAMRPFSALTAREKASEVLRWICVLPAAVLGGFAASYISYFVGRLTDYRWGARAELNFAYDLLLLIHYIPKEAAFVIAGANTAPRSRLATTVVLIIAKIIILFIVHVVGQINTAAVNYLHFAAESGGAALGLAYIFYSEKSKCIPQ
jgi:hypothetical protein